MIEYKKEREKERMRTETIGGKIRENLKRWKKKNKEYKSENIKWKKK